MGDTLDHERNPRYLAYIRTLPCVTCGNAPSEAHHTGPHGIGIKASDYTAIPLCTEHHTAGRAAYHKIGRARFEWLVGRSVDSLIEKYNRWWKRSKDGR